MKKFYYLAAGIVMILVTIMACEKSAIGVDEIQTLSKEEVLLSKVMPKINVCHYDEVTDTWETLSINGNALQAHLDHGDTEGECGPTCVETSLLTGSVAVESSSTENLNLAGAVWSVVLNADCSVTFCLTPTLFYGSPVLKALTVGIITEAQVGGIDLTYLSSDGSTPDDELVSTDGGVTYCYTAPAGSLPSGEVGIFFMVNGRAPDDGNDLQRWIGITPMTSANDFGGFDWSWANRFKITLP